MSKKNDGGPAFPHDGQANYTGGMSLRDYFAAKAMQGWLASFSGENGWPGKHLLSMASDFYAMADAMLEARNAE